MQRTMLLGLVAATLACAQSQPPGARDTANPATNETARPTASPPTDTDGPARLTARPRTKITDPLPAGLQALGSGSRRDGALYVPANLAGPAALVVMLHGAGGEARRALNPFLDQADDEGLVLLAVDSRDRTWDVIVGGYGPDVTFLDNAPERVFSVSSSTRSGWSSKGAPTAPPTPGVRVARDERPRAADSADQQAGRPASGGAGVQGARRGAHGWP